MGLGVIDINIIPVSHENLMKFSLLLSLFPSLGLFLTCTISSIIIIFATDEADESSNDNRGEINS